MSELVNRLLSKPVAPASDKPDAKPELTKQFEVQGDTATAVYNVPAGEQAPHSNAALIEHGLDPTEWVMTGFKSSEWTMANGDTGVSNRATFARKAQAPERLNIDELIEPIQRYLPRGVRRPHDDMDYGFIVALGDMQFGKIDGDDVAGTLDRTIAYLNKAADLLWTYAARYPINHVHIAWLGDHVEGFVSQGGANTFRTSLTMNEQIRLVRRVMLHALLTFADTADRVTMAAVPGNHGEPQRFGGKGITRYDDSHDTESLIAVADAAALNPAAFEHVEFYVPSTDEMTVVLDVAGTTVGHVHGHQFTRGKVFDWWKGQAFDPDNPLGKAELLLAGHLHHEHIESDGKRLFVQVPSMESESTWFRHRTGTSGNPGLIVAVTKDGVTSPLEFVR